MAGEYTFFKQCYLLTTPFLYIIPHDPDQNGTFLWPTDLKYRSDYHRFLEDYRDKNLSYLFCPEREKGRMSTPSNIKVSADGSKALFIKTKKWVKPER